jgi:hypothetical protein
MKGKMRRWSMLGFPVEIFPASENCARMCIGGVIDFSRFLFSLAKVMQVLTLVLDPFRLLIAAFFNTKDYYFHLFV